jgi:hypothetical protein
LFAKSFVAGLCAVHDVFAALASSGQRAYHSSSMPEAPDRRRSRRSTERQGTTARVFLFSGAILTRWDAQP